MFQFFRSFIIIPSIILCLHFTSTKSFNAKSGRIISVREGYSLVSTNNYGRVQQSSDKYSEDSLGLGRGLGPSAPSPGFLRSRFPSLPWYRVPNILTYLRCFAVPIFLLVFVGVKNHKNIILLSIFTLVSITDYLDGALARRWDVTSTFGAFLDPVADKIAVSTALILLSGKCGSIVSIPTTIILAREISVSALREWMAQRSMRDVVGVGRQGKLKTALTMISISLLLATLPSNPPFVSETVPWKFGICLLYLSTILTLTSGLAYFKAAIQSSTE